MLSENRHLQIMDLIREKGSVTVSELSERLAASESTIRRDLNELDEMGLLKKVFGGAVLNSVTFESRDVSVDSRAPQNHGAKDLIARKAASLIQANDFVYLDAETTTELMIPYITAREAVFVTNGFSHAKKLSGAGFKTFILGGEIKSSAEAVIGALAVKELDSYSFTKGFFGTNGVNLKSGFTTPDIREALVKEKAMSQCMEKYVLADSSKFSQISCAKFSGLEETFIITEKAPEGEYRNLDNIIGATETSV